MSKLTGFADACPHCGHVNCLTFHTETFEWECRECSRRWRADPYDPRLPRDPEAE